MNHFSVNLHLPLLVGGRYIQRIKLSSMVGNLVPVSSVGSVGIISPPRFGKDYKWYISGIFPANWGIICHLPPFRGTRNNH